MRTLTAPPAAAPPSPTPPPASGDEPAPASEPDEDDPLDEPPDEDPLADPPEEDPPDDDPDGDVPDDPPDELPEDPPNADPPDDDAADEEPDDDDPVVAGTVASGVTSGVDAGGDEPLLQPTTKRADSVHAVFIVACGFLQDEAARNRYHGAEVRATRRRTNRCAGRGQQLTETSVMVPRSRRSTDVSIASTTFLSARGRPTRRHTRGSYPARGRPSGNAPRHAEERRAVRDDPTRGERCQRTSQNPRLQ